MVVVKLEAVFIDTGFLESLLVSQIKLGTIPHGTRSQNDSQGDFRKVKMIIRYFLV